jgi:aminocarboxymuconate-semialdehyde decarboxylase
MRIDVHAHFIPPRLDELITGRGNAAGPSANMRDSLSDLNVRMADMTERGIDIELISPAPWVINTDPATVTNINNAIAESIAPHKDRFIGLAGVAMQEPELAAKELERCVKDLGFRGCEIISNVKGENLHERRFAPLYKKMIELDVPAFIHPNNVLGRDRLEPFFLNNLIGNPTDTAVAAACLIFGGVLQEMPKLKFVLAHGGGTCPLLRGRWEHAWELHLVDTPITRPPSEYFRYLYFDSLTHSVQALNSLVEQVGPDRVMLGSDYPFGMGDFTPPATVAALPHASDAHKDLMFSGNAIRVFGLDGLV